jgi:sugar phosphate isomerase/epimerase
VKIGLARYPAPPDVGNDRRLAWTVEAAGRLGLQIVGGDFRPVFGWDPRQFDLDELRRVRARADELDVEIEPYVGGLFDLAGPDGDDARARFLASIAAARVLGGPYVRAGYGQLTVETSRFNREIPLERHLERLIASLRLAAPIARDEGVVIALENHCDFTGREIARVVEAIDSPALRAALDTGNSFTVFCDPADDLEALAHHTVTTHLKDMTIVPRIEPGRVPYLAIGCALGQGNVPIAAVVRRVLAEGPRGRETPLIVEGGWTLLEPGADPVRAGEEMVAQSIAYLRSLA